MNPQTQLQLGHSIVVNLRSKLEYEEAIRYFRYSLQLQWCTHRDFDFVADFDDAPAGTFCIRIYKNKGAYYAAHGKLDFYEQYHIYHLTDFQSSSIKGI